MKKTRKASTGDPAAEKVAEMLEQVVEVEGRQMTLREAMLLKLYKQSLGGDIRASIELQDIRDRCGVEDQPVRVGCLVVPEPMDPDEFDKFASEQQRQFRETNYGTDVS